MEKNWEPKYLKKCFSFHHYHHIILILKNRILELISNVLNELWNWKFNNYLLSILDRNRSFLTLQRKIWSLNSFEFRIVRFVTNVGANCTLYCFGTILVAWLDPRVGRLSSLVGMTSELISMKRARAYN